MMSGSILFRLLASLGLGMVLVLLILSLPLFLLLYWGMLFVWAGITHLLVYLLGGKRDYAETFKALSYAYAPAVFSWIPLINWLAFVYMIVLMVIGIRQRQKMSLARSIAAVLLPTLTLTTLVLVGYLFSILLMLTKGGFT
jgi:hypothetical protein